MSLHFPLPFEFQQCKQWLVENTQTLKLYKEEKWVFSCVFREMRNLKGQNLLCEVTIFLHLLKSY